MFGGHFQIEMKLKTISFLLVVLCYMQGNCVIINYAYYLMSMAFYNLHSG